MLALTSLVVVLFLSLITVRIAAEALTLTGMSRQAARFQARSAWTGTGFTTAEAESVVGHPVRRQIIGLLMLMRSAGLVTAASTLMLSFVNVEQRDQGLERFLILFAALVVLYWFSRSRRVDRWLSLAIAWALKRFTDLEARDYLGLLHLGGEYALMDLKVRKDGWMDGRTLDLLRLPDEGVLVLGVTQPDGTYLGAPHGSTRIEAEATILLYGRSSTLAALGKRKSDVAGSLERQRSVAEQAKIERQEDRSQDEEDHGPGGARAKQARSE
jgi:hypothetical protein